VVALKPALPLATTTIFFLKQERRGGIETQPTGPSRPGLPKKQERRGGIETKFNFLPRIIPRREAGTPWWH